MSAANNITKYLIQVNPYKLSSAFEIWIDLKDHMCRGTAYEVDEYELHDTIVEYFDRTDFDRYSHKDLANRIVRRFRLENR